MNQFGQLPKWSKGPGCKPGGQKPAQVRILALSTNFIFTPLLFGGF